jgi:AraC-like DNA-binding protein
VPLLHGGFSSFQSSAVAQHAQKFLCMVIMFRRLCGSEECPLPWLSALEGGRMAVVFDRMLQRPEADHSLESLAVAAARVGSAGTAHSSIVFRSRSGMPPGRYRQTELWKRTAGWCERCLPRRQVAAVVRSSQWVKRCGAAPHDRGAPTVLPSHRFAA